MVDPTFTHLVWALTLGAISAVSLPLGSLIGLRLNISQKHISMFAAFGAGALIAALSVELVAPTCLELELSMHEGGDNSALIRFFALLAGGLVGGVLFVLLDDVVNQNGGYLRKRATTLSHLAKNRRNELQQKMEGIFALAPFDRLSDELKPGFIAILHPLSLPVGKNITVSTEDALIVLDGELEIELENGIRDAAGPGTFVGVLSFFLPDLVNPFVVKAVTNAQCLILRRQDINRFRKSSPEFDQACRSLASERIERLEQILTHQMEETVAWARSAAGAIREGSDLPGPIIRFEHSEHKASPLAVWLGILLDGIPESLVIGAGLYVVLLHHPEAESLRFVEVIPFTLIAGLFLSNFPEALSSSANMLAGGLNRKRIFWMWTALMVMTAVGSVFGFVMAGFLNPPLLVFAQGVAAGAMLTMISAAMIPDATAHGHLNLVGLSTLGGFLTAVLFKLFE